MPEEKTHLAGNMRRRDGNINMDLKVITYKVMT
jgi:hypothetical protein